MKTDIWKDNKTLPEILKDIAFYINGDIHYGYFGETAFWDNGNSGFFKPEDVEKWCYLNDLLEQSSKIERLENIIQGISDYVFGNGLATMAASSIEKIYNQNNIKVEWLEMGKTKTTIMENNNAE